MTVLWTRETAQAPSSLNTSQTLFKRHSWISTFFHVGDQSHNFLQFISIQEKFIDNLPGVNAVTTTQLLSTQRRILSPDNKHTDLNRSLANDNPQCWVVSESSCKEKLAEWNCPALSLYLNAINIYKTYILCMAWWNSLYIMDQSEVLKEQSLHLKMLPMSWVLHMLFKLRKFSLLTFYKCSSQLYWINPQAVIWKHKTGTWTNSQQGNNFLFLLTSCKCQLAIPQIALRRK